MSVDSNIAISIYPMIWEFQQRKISINMPDNRLLCIIRTWEKVHTENNTLSANKEFAFIWLVRSKSRRIDITEPVFEFHWWWMLSGKHVKKATWKVFCVGVKSFFYPISKARWTKFVLSQIETASSIDMHISEKWTVSEIPAKMQWTCWRKKRACSSWKT